MRLFLSIALPEKLREQIIESREEVKQTSFTREQLQRMRWINEKEYHVTQYFIGEVNSERVQELKPIIQQIVASTKSFTLISERFEFKPRNNPRFLWLRFQANETFAALQLQVHNALVEIELSNSNMNDDPIPHVTLLRLKQVKPLNNELPIFTTQTLNATHIDLMQSFMKPAGAEYKMLERFNLKE